jgi:hypothetical protein
MAAAASLGEQSLQAGRIPGPDFPHRSGGVQFCGTTTCFVKPSQQVSGVLGSDFLHGLLEAQFCGAAAGLGEESLHAAVVPWPQVSFVVAWATKPALLRLLLPMEQQETWELST